MRTIAICFYISEFIRFSYGGGTRPWGGGNNFRSPSTEDGLIEVIGLTTYQLVSNF